MTTRFLLFLFLSEKGRHVEQAYWLTKPLQKTSLRLQILMVSKFESYKVFTLQVIMYKAESLRIRNPLINRLICKKICLAHLYSQQISVNTR